MTNFEEKLRSIKLWFVLETISLHSSQTKSALDPGSDVILSHIRYEFFKTIVCFKSNTAKEIEINSIL